MDLTGADLDNWRFEGPAKGPPLNLISLHLAGCRLMNARFRQVDLSGADLTGADLRSGRRYRTQLLG
jgi:uncharacterized protein YjbI with pentapeptide repeats